MPVPRVLRRIVLSFAVAVAALAFLPGCSSVSYLEGRNFRSRLQSLRSVAMLPAKVSVYEISTGGVREKMDEWSDTATVNVSKALAKQIGAMSGVAVRSVPKDSLSAAAVENLEETQALYEAIDASIALHLYGDETERFSDRKENFAYSLGPQVKDISPDCDMYLLVRGAQITSSTGRTVAKVGAAIVAAFFGARAGPDPDPTLLTLSLVDRESGEILWYNRNVNGVDDLRNEEDAEAMVTRLFDKFPLGNAPDAAPGGGR